MYLSEPTPFDDVLAILAELENRINHSIRRIRQPVTPIEKSGLSRTLGGTVPVRAGTTENPVKMGASV